MSATVGAERGPERRVLIGVLVLLGVGWGLTQPLGKIATMGGAQPFGLIFWQLVICVLVLGALSLPRGKGLVFNLSLIHI